VIEFRRLLTRSDFATPVDFVDFTVIPPGSTIGLHDHHGNEEIYFIVSGQPRVAVNGEEIRLHSGQAHELVNDTDENVEMFVIQVKRIEGWRAADENEQRADQLVDER
jgi:mannose-6-phosphate isomerase-like protein (cupin superfamily)